MTIGRHSRYFEQVKDSQLFDHASLVITANYKAIRRKQRLRIKKVVQHHVTDWDFLLMRARSQRYSAGIRERRCNKNNQTRYLNRTCCTGNLRFICSGTGSIDGRPYAMEKCRSCFLGLCSTSNCSGPMHRKRKTLPSPAI